MATRTPLNVFQALNGRRFAVRVLPHGARYVCRNEGTNFGQEALVEFYDTTYADDGNADDLHDFGPLGQFVARHYLGTILGTDGFGSGIGALTLDDGQRDTWTIDGSTMANIRRWLQEFVPVDGT